MLYHPVPRLAHPGISDKHENDWREANPYFHDDHLSTHLITDSDGAMIDPSTSVTFACVVNPPSASPRSVAPVPVPSSDTSTSKSFRPTLAHEGNDATIGIGNCTYDSFPTPVGSAISKTTATKTKGTLSPSFPQILMKMLDSSSSSGGGAKSKKSVIEWRQDGRSFVIHDKDRFAAEILPVHFKSCSKFASFARRLHRWGFTNITARDCGDGSCTFRHPKFCRDMPELCRQMNAGGVDGGSDGRPANPHGNLPLPKGFDDMDAAQAVLSLGLGHSPAPFRLPSTSSMMCLGMVDADEDGDENTLAAGNDIASRLKRMADCCRRYDLLPNQHFATMEGGGAMVLLPKTSKSGEEIEPLLNQVRETMRDGTDAGKGKRKGSTDLTPSDIDEIRTRASKPREAKRPKTANTSTSNNDISERNNSITGASKGGKKLPPHEVYCKPALEFGKGWIVRGFQRQSGAYEGHVDKYWYSPNLKKRFRSKAEIKRFLPLLKKCHGDEEKAYKMFKGVATGNGFRR